MRAARFEISRECLLQRPKLMGAFFRELAFVPLGIEPDLCRDVVKITGYSDKFEDVPLGTMIPDLLFRIHKDEEDGWEILLSDLIFTGDYDEN